MNIFNNTATIWYVEHLCTLYFSMYAWRKRNKDEQKQTFVFDLPLHSSEGFYLKAISGSYLNLLHLYLRSTTIVFDIYQTCYNYMAFSFNMVEFNSWIQLYFHNVCLWGVLEHNYGRVAQNRCYSGWSQAWEWGDNHLTLVCESSLSFCLIFSDDKHWRANIHGCMQRPQLSCFVCESH